MMAAISKDLQTLLERIENLEGDYSLSDIAFLKAHYDELKHRLQALEAFAQSVINNAPDQEPKQLTPSALPFAYALWVAGQKARILLSFNNSPSEG